MNNGYWGKYNQANSPRIHYDPLQSFEEDGQIFGFRVHIVPSRNERPREFSRTEKPKSKTTQKTTSQSVLTDIVEGKEPAIVISADDEILDDPLDEPQIRKLLGYGGVTIMNKFSPLNANDPNHGFALISFPIRFSTSFYDIENVENCLVPLRSAVRFLIEKYENLHSSLIFINNGRRSGASLRQLHAQAYVVNKNSGIISYSFNQSFKNSEKCLICQLVSLKIDRDHIGQDLRYQERVVWENSEVSVVVPYAPIRFLGLRILIKEHRSWFGQLTNSEINSLSQALVLAHELIIRSTPDRWSPLVDRTVAFRQSLGTTEDFHMFIDVLPSIPYGGSEVIDSLSVTPLDPFDLSSRMQNEVNDILKD